MAGMRPCSAVTVPVPFLLDAFLQERHQIDDAAMPRTLWKGAIRVAILLGYRRRHGL